jgi:hypothetical protein
VGEVEDSGRVTFFEEIFLEVQGQTTQEVAQLVGDAIEKKSGRRPTSIGVIRVPRDDPRRATSMMMEIYVLRKQGCRDRIPPGEVPDWLPNDLQHIAEASHNRSSGTKTGSA